MRKNISLAEIENKWTLEMVYDANEALDIEDELEQKVADKMRRDSR